MSDEREPTPDELLAAAALADELDGRANDKLPLHLQETSDFLKLAAKGPDHEQLARVKARLNLRRRPRWLVRGSIGVALGVACALVAWYLLVARAASVPKPSAELLAAEAAAAKSGDPQAAERAMQAYRRELVQMPALARAAAVHARADAAIAAADYVRARSELEALTEPGAFKEPIARDAWFRTATIELRAGRAQVAVADADRGLALGRPQDVLTVNLLLARSAAKRSQGDMGAAADDLHSAITLLEALTTAALEGGE